MPHVRLVRMSGAHMALAPRWWRWWQRWGRQTFEVAGDGTVRRIRPQRPIRREIGVPIGQHWEMQFTWYA